MSTPVRPPLTDISSRTAMRLSPKTVPANHSLQRINIAKEAMVRMLLLPLTYPANTGRVDQLIGEKNITDTKLAQREPAVVLPHSIPWHRLR
jgi:hypothetical protein